MGCVSCFLRSNRVFVVEVVRSFGFELRIQAPSKINGAAQSSMPFSFRLTFPIQPQARGILPAVQYKDRTRRCPDQSSPMVRNSTTCSHVVPSQSQLHGTTLDHLQRDYTQICPQNLYQIGQCKNYLVID